ncbi:MAG: Uma2 family endonuclease [Acidobacteria bacterium]|nr:Uma2 family endonuclease [Acidobacteriota bacterium]
MADFEPRPHVARAGSPTAPAPALPVDPFPGCTARRVTRSEIDTWEGRLEFWDAATEIAWVAAPTTPYHEKPSRRLTAVMDRIAAERGSAIVCYGSMDLMQRDEHGAPRRILQADESVYVHPRRARLPGPKAMMAGEDDFPDVVLEVDHTTDVRRAKLGLYEAWGFPEVWVEVPAQGAASRPRRRRPGLTIHRRVAGAFQASAASGAFPGWTAAEIHAALNETELSERTFAVLQRVGGALGARDGTGPDDDPMLGWHRRQGRAEGRAASRREMVGEILRGRGTVVSDEGLARVAQIDVTTDDAVVRAALACKDEADLVARLRRRR